MYTAHLVAAAVLLAAGSAVSAGLPADADPGNLPHGIPCFGKQRVDYQRAGAPLVVTFGEPVTVAVADRPLAWGFFQFPDISRWEDGTLCVQWHMGPDSAVGYGTERGRAVSRDGGRTWERRTGPEHPTGLLLPNGDRIESVLPKALPLAEVTLPKPAGTVPMSYGGTPMVMYREADLPAKLRGIPLRRRPKGAAVWKDERAVMDDPQALRYHFQGMFPVLWLGDIRLLGDGSLIAGIYPGYRLLDDGTIDPKDGAFFYRSVDGGHRWSIQGRIPYQPDLHADPKADQRDGFTEPATEVLADGSLLCVLRVTDGAGIGPLYASRSTDMGRKWTRPAVITANGVLPRLLRLGNGVVVLSSGRPGVQLRFNAKGDAVRWTDPFEMLPWNGDAYVPSCGYTGLLATGKDRFLIVYSDFQHRDGAGHKRKAVMVREVTVTRRR